MNALPFLLIKRFKNTLKEFFRTPSKLILFIVLVVMIGATVFGGIMGKNENTSFRDAREAYTIIFALYLFVFISVTMSGLKNGASFFTMADVNILFNAPISQKKILVFGLVRQLGVTVMLALFLVFQYGWMSSNYGMTMLDLLGVIIGYILLVFSAQLIAMGIYAYSSHSDQKKKTIKTVIYLFVAAVAAYILYPVFTAADKIGAVVTQVSSKVIYYVPVAGWLKAFFEGFMSGNLQLIFLGLGAVVLFVGLFIIIILKMDADYYEDVLVATEVGFSAITAKKEGRMAEAVPQNVKVGKTGIGRGKGASVFFFKHLLEDRRARFFILDLFSFIVIIGSAIFAFFMRNYGILAPFCFSVYMMVLSSFNGRWLKELTMPFVYMLPVNPFKKLVMIILQQILKGILESVIVIGIIGMITGASIPQMIGYTLVRIGACLVFIAANTLTERLFGGALGKSLQMMFYFLVLIVLAAPGVVGAIFAAGISELIGLLIAASWLTLVSCAVIYFCRNILSNAEFNNK